MDEIDVTALREAFNKMAEAMREIWEAIRVEIVKIVDAVVALYVSITRHLLFYHLRVLRVPFKIASWLASKWPRRWLPFKWAWAILT